MVSYEIWTKRVHRQAEKKKPIFFCVHLFNLTETGEYFLTYINESTSYNSEYLFFGLR